MEAKLPARLRAVADYIPPGETVADIGTDHALLPVYLVSRGLNPQVIAVEKAAGPLEAARRAVAESGLNAFIEIRAGDGLKPLRPGEAGVLVLAGMGGRTIAEILDAAPVVAGAADTLVLQPQEPVAPARRWVVDHGFRIDDENLVDAGGRLYPLIRAVKGPAPPVDEFLLEVGPVLVAKKHPLLGRYLAGIAERYRHVLAELDRSARGNLDERRAAVRARLQRLEELRKCL
ncbi:MAG: SAM-dependent methyltransferase [Candidatus Desulforudis sp.]|nr:SAM-dependent methyltransferase [Desulforudis sp.]